VQKLVTNCLLHHTDPMIKQATKLTAAEERQQMIRAVVASAVGTTIEWYDFFLYGVAAALATTAHVLRNGEIAMSAPGNELLDNPQLLKSYLGR